MTTHPYPRNFTRIWIATNPINEIFIIKTSFFSIKANDYYFCKNNNKIFLILLFIKYCGSIVDTY